MPYDDFTISRARGLALDVAVTVTKDGLPTDLTTWTDLVLIAKGTPSAHNLDWLIFVALSKGTVTLTNAAAGQYTAHVPAASFQALGNKKRTLYVDLYGVDAAGVAWAFGHGKLLMESQTGGSVAFVPSQLSGLKGDVSADQGLFQDNALSTAAVDDGAPVGGWKGKGGAAHRYWNDDATRKPTKRTSVLNGLPVVRGDGVDDGLYGPNLSTLISSLAFTMFVVGRAMAGGAGAIDDNWPRFISDDKDDLFLAVGAAGQAGLYHWSGNGAATAVVPYTLGTFALFEARHGTARTGHSGSIASGGVSQSVMLYNANRVAGTITNTSAGNLWIGLDVPATLSAPSLLIAPGASRTFADFGQDGVNIIGAVGGLTFAASEDSGVIGLRVNGGTEATALSGETEAGPGEDNSGPPLKVATGLFGGNVNRCLNGDIAEVLIYNRDLSDNEKAAVRTYLSNKWDVPAYNVAISVT